MIAPAGKNGDGKSNDDKPFGNIRHRKKRAFLTAYAKVGVATRAAQVSKVNRDSHRIWLQDDPEYATAFEIAVEMSCEALETEARRRAVEGVKRPVFQGGEKVGVVQEYSDTLLIFLMKGAMPAKYRERIEHSGNVNSTLKFSPEVVAAASLARQQLLEERRKELTNGNGHGHLALDG